MPQIAFNTLWANHPFPDKPCSKYLFENQCAIRMGVALELSGVNTASFDAMFPGRRCSAYPALKHERPHILGAQELATWMRSQTHVFGEVEIHSWQTRDVKQFVKKKGIVFIMNGWGSTDHFDLWNGIIFKTDQLPTNLGAGEQLWFWELQ